MNLDRLKSKLSYLTLGVLIPVAGIGMLVQFPRLFSYLHYLRMPLLAGVALLGLPIITRYTFPGQQDHWFVAHSPQKLASIIIAVVWVGLGIAIAAQVLWNNIPCRYFNECALIEAADVSLWPYVIAMLLGMPTIGFSYRASVHETKQMTAAQSQVGAGCGISCAVLLLWMAYYLNTHPALIDIQQCLYTVFSYLPGSGKGFIVNDKVATGHTEMFWFISFAAVLSLGSGQIFRSLLQKHQPPALFYVLILMVICTLSFSFLTFWLDYYDIPVLLFALAWTMTVYCFWGAEHHYDLKLVSNNVMNKPTNGKLTHNH